MNSRFQILSPRSGLYREAPFRGLCIFSLDSPGNALILRSSLCKAFSLLSQIRSLLGIYPRRIAIFGCRFAERPKKTFGSTLEVRFKELGSDEHVAVGHRKALPTINKLFHILRVRRGILPVLSFAQVPSCKFSRACADLLRDASIPAWEPL